MLRRTVAGAAVLFLVSTSASAGAGWRRVTLHREQGRIAATLSYETRGGDYRRMTLVVRRSGKVVLDWLFPAGAGERVGATLRLRDVWGDSDPEALVLIQTCGNRCGEQLAVGLPGARRVVVGDVESASGCCWVGRGRRSQLVAEDVRFFCAFATCADAQNYPVQVMAIDTQGQRFVDVTQSRLDLVAADAAAFWKAYLGDPQEFRNHEHALSILAAWCADEYRLGQERRCHQTLATDHVPRAAIDDLDKYLVAWGYEH